MQSRMIRSAALFLTSLVSISSNLAADPAMVRLVGTPEEIGRTWGETNKAAIVHAMEVDYLKKAATEGITQEALIERSAQFVRIVEKIAPHWLEEFRATARAAGVDETLYVAFRGSRARNRFLHECTSYAVSPELTRGGAILFHKNRDNVAKQQAAYILASSVEGIHKFIAIGDASGIGCSMMVNEKGLAASGDYPAELTRKNDPNALLPKPAEPRYRGLMSGDILRYLGERASNCQEALEIVEDFVKKGYYAGGKVNGQHWLFVDRHGTILEISSNARHVASRFHKNTVYFSRLDGSRAARRLREAGGPIDFHLFHNVSRDKSICLKSSIASMTAEIDREHPELFTCAWITVPASSVSFPLLMGQSETPACLVNGKAYTLGTTTKGKTGQWEAVQRKVHAEKELLGQTLALGQSSNDPEKTAETLNRWSGQQSAMLLEMLRASQ